MSTDDEPRDLFGRTEAEVVAAIAHAERIYKISAVYSGNEGLALELARKKGNIEVDRRELAILRGEKKRDSATEIAPSGLAKWRREFMAVGTWQGRKR